MADEVRAALAAGCELLSALSQQRAETDDALERAAALGRDHAAVRIDLVWDSSDPLGDRQYMLILRHGTDTITLTVASSHDVPWALRGMTRWSERDVVVVNGQTISVHDVVASLDFAWGELDIAGHLIDQALLRQLLGQLPDAGTAGDPSAVDDDEVQRSFDDFRTRRGLESPAALEAWMDRRGVSLDQLEHQARADATRRRVRQVVIGGDVARHFEDHRDDYHRIDVVRAGPFLDDEVAQIRRDPDRLAAVVESAFVAGRAVESSVTRYYRHQLEPAMADAIFSAEPGTVVGPFAGDLVKVLRLRPAQLDGALRAVIEERLFARWLEQRRGEAHIQWLWGNARSPA